MLVRYTKYKCKRRAQTEFRIKSVDEESVIYEETLQLSEIYKLYEGYHKSHSSVSISGSEWRSVSIIAFMDIIKDMFM